MVIYDNEALRSAHLDIDVSCSSFFYICLLMQLYCYRPFSPIHRIMMRRIDTATTNKTLLLHSVSVDVSDFMCMYVLCARSSRFSIRHWAKNNGIPFTPNKNYSHIVAMHSNLCVEWDGDRNMKRSHTWHQFQRKWTFNSKFIVSIPASCYVTLSLSLFLSLLRCQWMVDYYHIFMSVFVIFWCLLMIEIKSRTKASLFCRLLW